MQDIKYQNSLNSIVSNCKIIIDTSSILEPGCGTFLKDISDFLFREKKCIAIPTACLSEVEKHRNNPEFNSIGVNLDEIVVSLNALKDMGLVSFIGTEKDLVSSKAKYADSEMIKEVPIIAKKSNVLFITQDKILNLKLLLETENSSQRFIAASIDNSTGKIAFRRMDELWEKILKDEERLKSLSAITKTEQYKLDEIKNLKKHQSLKKLNQTKKTALKSKDIIPENEMFTETKTISTVIGVIPVTHIPDEGDSVFIVKDNSRESIVLKKQLASGGEGTVYITGKTGIVAKIYKEERITQNRFEKLKLMISKDIEFQGICFPIALIYNLNDEFVGYAMKEAKGKPLQSCVFVPMLLQNEFPGWSRKDTVQLSITILEKIKYLHDRNVILGDINPQNILVVSSEEVYFVDTDSYQIEGFPCPVGTLVFTAPEIQGKDFGSFLRSKGNEHFAIATLLFMIMLPGKAPYAMQGSEDMKRSIISMDFAYPLGEQKTGMVAKGKWRFMWSHMPYSLKQAFYLTFSKEEFRDKKDKIVAPHNSEKTRYNVNDWIRLFNEYKKDLPCLIKEDPMSSSLRPTRFRKGHNQTIEKCSVCGEEFVRNYDQAFTTCYDCSNKDKEKRRKEQERLNKVYQNITCAACGKNFAFTYREKEKFEKSGWSLPRRCPDCIATGVISKPSYSSNKPQMNTNYKQPVAYAQPVAKSPVMPAYTPQANANYVQPVAYAQPVAKSPVTPTYTPQANINYAQPVTNSPVMPAYTPQVNANYVQPVTYAQPVANRQTMSAYTPRNSRKAKPWYIVAAIIVLMIIIGAAVNPSTPESKLGVSSKDLQMIPDTSLYCAFIENSSDPGWTFKVYSSEHSYDELTVSLDIYDSNDDFTKPVATAKATIDYSAGTVARLYFDFPSKLDINGTYLGILSKGETNAKNTSDEYHDLKK